MKNKDKKSMLLSKSNILWIASLAVIFVIATGIFVSGIMEYHILRDARENIDKEANKVQDEINQKEHDLDAEMDDSYIESVAKEELDLINPDEIIYHDNVNN